MKAIISGGGTGGHIFPAIAIANALRAKYPDAQVLFVGAKGKMEMQKVPQAGYQIIGLPISGFQRKKLWKNIALPFKVLYSTLKAKKIVKSFSPDVVVGVGGYASGPTLAAAVSKHVPTIIQEQNSFPGATNKILAEHVDLICVAYDNMDRWFDYKKIVFTGNPIRQSISSLGENIEQIKLKALSTFSLDKTKRTVLVVGGSLGALTINESIYNSLDYFEKNDIQLIWQTGKWFFEKAKEKVESLKSNHIKVYEFVYDMDLAYSVADVIISRAGAIAISELCIVGKPSILVPSPNVAEDHQTKNALALVNKDAALYVKDSEAEERMISLAIDTVKNKERLKMLSENIKKLAFPNSAEVIANEVLNLAKMDIN